MKLESETKWGWKRVILLLILEFLILFAFQSKKEGAIFRQMPEAFAYWEIASIENNHIGGAIKASFYVITKPGVLLDIENIPDVGDTVALPSKVIVSEQDNLYPLFMEPQVISEGQLEVVSREIRQYRDKDQVTTEISYEFQYLVPIDLDLPLDDKFLPTDMRVYQEYRIFIKRTGRIEDRSSRIRVGETLFYIKSRVTAQSRPIFELMSSMAFFSYWSIIKFLGFGFVILAFLIFGWRVVTKKTKQASNESLPLVDEMYDLWHQSLDQKVFLETLKLYRRGIWGQPQTSTWFLTTFILYSGVSLNQDQMESVFLQLKKEIRHD